MLLRPHPLSAARVHPRLTAGALALAAALALALVLALVLAVGVVTGGGEPIAPRGPEPRAETSPTVDTTQEATFARQRPGYPDRLVVPALGVDVPVVPVKAPGRTLTPPADPQVLGWWVDGARPGAETGSALVVGHTVHTGGGALDDLETLEDGDPVHVQSHLLRAGVRVARTTSYVVESVAVYRKGRLAQRAADLFSQEVDGRLVLLTCEDWDGTRYLSNVVVTATPVTDGDGSASLGG